MWPLTPKAMMARCSSANILGWVNRLFTIEQVGPDDHYADVFVDTNKAFEVYQAWLNKTRPAPGPDGLRRPLWMLRPAKPEPETYRMG